MLRTAAERECQREGGGGRKKKMNVKVHIAESTGSKRETLDSGHLHVFSLIKLDRSIIKVINKVLTVFLLCLLNLLVNLANSSLLTS